MKHKLPQLLFNFVTSNSKYSYNSYLNESIGITSELHYTKDQKEKLLRKYINEFLKEVK